MNELQARSGYRAEIDGLRALAVVLVMLFHFDIGPFSGGFVGVDVFFVISGFLITGLIQSEVAVGVFRFTRFWIRRARRILPASIVMMIVVSLVFAALYPVHLYEELAESLLAQTLFAANFYFWQDADYFSNSAELKPLLHTWSLSVEEQFYFVFPIVLLAINRFCAKHREAVVASICILSLLVSIQLTPLDRSAAFYLLPTRAWELGLGALLALSITRLPLLSNAMSLVMSMAGLSFIIFAALIFDEKTPFPSYRALAPTIGAALLIWGSAANNHVIRVLMSLAPIVWVGRLSYSLYLWHWPIAVLFAWYSIPVGASWHGVMALLLTFALANLSYRLIELPIRVNRQRFSDVSIGVGSIGCVIAVLALGVLGVVRGNGVIVDPDGEIEAFRSEAKSMSSFRLECTDLFKRGSEQVSCKRYYGDQSAGTDIFLWGDSHAAAILPGFDQAAKRLGYNLEFSFTNGCQAVIGMRRVDEDVGCASTNNAVMQHIRESRFPVVAVAGSYVNNVQAGRIRDVNAERLLNPENSIMEFERRFAETISIIHSAGSVVALFTEPPRQNRDPIATWVRDATLGRETSFSGVSRDEHQERITTLYETMERAGIDLRMDYTESLCPAGICNPNVGDHPLYSDASHLSEYGAVSLAKLISEDLQWLRSLAKTK